MCRPPRTRSPSITGPPGRRGWPRRRWRSPICCSASRASAAVSAGTAGGRSGCRRKPARRKRPTKAARTLRPRPPTCRPKQTPPPKTRGFSTYTSAGRQTERPQSGPPPATTPSTSPLTTTIPPPRTTRPSGTTRPKNTPGKTAPQRKPKCPRSRPGAPKKSPRRSTGPPGKRRESAGSGRSRLPSRGRSRWTTTANFPALPSMWPA